MRKHGKKPYRMIRESTSDGLWSRVLNRRTVMTSMGTHHNRSAAAARRRESPPSNTKVANIHAIASKMTTNRKSRRSAIRLVEAFGCGTSGTSRGEASGLIRWTLGKGSEVDFITIRFGRVVVPTNKLAWLKYRGYGRQVVNVGFADNGQHILKAGLPPAIATWLR